MCDKRKEDKACLELDYNRPDTRAPLPHRRLQVIGVSKLRKEYRVFEQRRQLAESYDLFLADERVLPSLPRLLGKTFFQKKKQPIPIRLMKKTRAAKSAGAVAKKKSDDTSNYCCWRSQVKDALDATYFFMPQGTTM